MKTSHRQGSILLRGAAAICALVGLVACSSSKHSTTGSGSTSPSSSQASGTTIAGPSGSPIKIGIICTCSGPLAGQTAAMPDVYRAWANSVNESGGINGHPIKIYLEDDTGTPGTSITDVHTLVESDQVIALVDMTNSDETWASYVQSKNVPVVGGGTSTTPMFSNPDFYPEGQTEDALFPSIIESAKGAGATNLGLLYCEEAVQCQEGIAPLKETGQKLGLPVTYSASVAATAPNYTAQCVAAQDAHITALFVADIGYVAIKVAQNCSQQGYHPIYVVDGEIITDAFATTSGIKDNLVGPAPNIPYYASSAAITAMNQAVDKYYPGLRTNATKWSELVSEGWPSGLLFADAAKAGGLGANGTTPTSAELVNGLHALKDDTLQGMASPLNFKAGQANPVHCWYNFSLKNGTYGLPNGVKTTCE